LSPTAGKGWKETLLYSFAGGSDGAQPKGKLLMDTMGNLYGTTSLGGIGNGYGYGTVFELTPSVGGGWTERVIYAFGGNDVNPWDGLIMDAAGNLYGTTTWGGQGYGSLFELSPAADGRWTEAYSWSFNYESQFPTAGLVMDASGNLYGTTVGGGNPYGTFYGTVFELYYVDGFRNVYTLYTFTGGSDGNAPYGGLVFDAAGNLYGTTAQGGEGNGVVFELSPVTGGGWSETVIHNFDGRKGAEPYSTLVFDAAGNLYGTTTYGGGENGHGTVFELMPSLGGTWTEKVLHVFDFTDGSQPYDGLILDSAGNLYGTTQSGAVAGCKYECGTVFEIIR